MNPLILGGVLDIGKSLIARLFPDPEERAKAERQLAQMEQDGELKRLSVRMSAIVAEANSEDPWTSRARPSFMYVFYFVIISLVVIAPILGVFNPEAMTQFFENVSKGFAAIPEELWWTFSAGYLGYTTMRTAEKKLRLPGREGPS